MRTLAKFGVAFLVLTAIGGFVGSLMLIAVNADKGAACLGMFACGVCATVFVCVMEALLIRAAEKSADAADYAKASAELLRKIEEQLRNS